MQPTKLMNTVAIRSTSPDEISNKKQMLFINISHHGWTQTQRMLTADWSLEQTCSDSW